MLESKGKILSCSPKKTLFSLTLAHSLCVSMFVVSDNGESMFFSLDARGWLQQVSKLEWWFIDVSK